MKQPRAFLDAIRDTDNHGAWVYICRGCRPKTLMNYTQAVQHLGFRPHNRPNPTLDILDAEREAIRAGVTTTYPVQ